MTCSDWSNNSLCGSLLVWDWFNHVNPLNGSETDHFNTQDIKYFITHSSANKSQDLFHFLEKFTIYWMNRIYKLVEKLDPIAISLKKNALHTRFKGYSSYFVYVVHNVLSDCTGTSGHSRHLSMSAKLNEMSNSLGLWPRVFSCWTLMRVACAGESSLNLQKREEQSFRPTIHTDMWH